MMIIIVVGRVIMTVVILAAGNVPPSSTIIVINATIGLLYTTPGHFAWQATKGAYHDGCAENGRGS
jgi:hypothetical protein